MGNCCAPNRVRADNTEKDAVDRLIFDFEAYV